MEAYSTYVGSAQSLSQKKEYKGMACGLAVASLVLLLLEGVGLYVSTNAGLQTELSLLASIIRFVTLLGGCVGYWLRSPWVMVACSVTGAIVVTLCFVNVMAIVILLMTGIPAANEGMAPTTLTLWFALKHTLAAFEALGFVGGAMTAWILTITMVAQAYVCQVMARARALLKVEDPAVPLVVGVYGAV